MSDNNTSIEKMENSAESSVLANVEERTNNMSMWSDPKQFNTIFKMAKLLATSNIVPQAYQNNVGNCLIAIDMANRMGVSPSSVMQDSQVIYNTFTWKGKACKAMIDGCGKYKSTQYVEVGTRGKDDWGFYIQAVTNNGETINGTPVTIQMAKDEEWYGRNKKWSTMPELMLKYRCASFFAKTECPNVLMGFQTTEELQDVKGIEKDSNVVTIELNGNEVANNG